MKLPFLLNSVNRCRNLNEVESVFKKLLKALPTLDGDTVSNCLNNLSKKEINHPKFFWKRAADLLTQNSVDGSDSGSILSKYDVKDVCIILNSFAKVNYLFLNLVDASTKIIKNQVRNVHTKELCNVIHSLGKFNQIAPISEILNNVFKNRPQDIGSVEKIFSTLENCNEQDFSMLLRVFLINSEGLKFDSVTQNLLGSLSQRFDNLSDQTLAILANSVAMYGKDDNNTLGVLSPIITFRLRKGYFTPQCVAQISNGYARLNVRDSDLFTAIAYRVLLKVDEFPPRCLVNVLNAFSKIDFFEKDLFLSSIPQLENTISQMTPQCIGNAINAYSKFIVHLNRPLLVSFFNKIIEYVLKMRDFDSFIGQNYANILNGVSKLYVQGLFHRDYQEGEGDQNVESESFLTRLGVEREFVNSEEPEELKILELFDKLSDPMIGSIDELNHLDVLMIVNSMARCKVVIEPLLDKLLVKLKEFHKKYKNYELVNVLNTLSILFSCQSSDVNFIDDKGIREKLKNYYSYFLDYYIGVLDNFNDIRSLDIKLVFNSLGRFNIYNENYCKLLINKYIGLKHFNLGHLMSIVNYYSEMKVPLPSELQKYIVGSLKSGKGEDMVLVQGRQMTIGEVVEHVNALA